MQPTHSTHPSARQRGQATIEFAMGMLVLFMMLFGILEVSHLVFTVSDLSNGAREGAHYAALHPETTVYSLTQQIAPTLFIMSAGDVQVMLDCPTCSGPGACLGAACAAIYQPLTVTLGYTLTTVVPFPGFGSGIPIRMQATARRER